MYTMRLYVVALPVFKSGGPESLHQLCDALLHKQYDASMVYSKDNDEILTNPSDILYHDIYPILRQTVECDVIDSQDTIIVIPETFSAARYKKRYPKSHIAVWWLSYTHGLGALKSHLTVPHLIHLFQSFHAKNKLRSIVPEPHLMMRDYIRDDIMQAGFDTNTKENLVAVNIAKDYFTPQVCQRYNIPYVRLGNMTRAEIIRTLQRCKVYVDFGTHPGRDRIPREASVLGCVVITNRECVADNDEDVPIHTKLATWDPHMLASMIQNAFANYRIEFEKQEKYRRLIGQDQDELNADIDAFVDYIVTSAAKII